MTDTIETRVARGAALLDEKLPGWVDRIDLDKLDIGNPCQCVLGQTWAGDVHPDSNEYLAHADDLFGHSWDDDTGSNSVDIRHGFNAFWREDAAALAAEWRRVIEARRSGS